jgi:hypothetical protein
MAPNRESFLLNKGEFERVRTGLRNGKVDLAFVVAAKIIGDGRPPEYQGADHIETVAANLADRPTISGRYGEFWALQLGDIDADAPL